MKLVTCTFCGQTMDFDDTIEHGIKVHNHHMAKVIKEKQQELETMLSKMTGKKVNLKPSDIIDDELIQEFLDLSKQMREEGR